MANRTEWAEKAVRGIISAKERANARQELLDHIEDHMADLLAAGFTLENAEKQAVFAMGDPETTAKLLRKTHQPVLTRLLQASYWLLGAVLAILMVHLLSVLSTSFFGDLFPEKKIVLTPAQEVAPWFSPDSFDSYYADCSELWLLEPNTRLHKGDYIFTVTQAAVSRMAETDYLPYQITLCLEVARENRLSLWPHLSGNWEAVTEKGGRSTTTFYDIRTESHLFCEPHQNQKQFLLLFNGRFTDVGQWVDLSYSNGESDFTIRVMLEGGTEYAP